MFIHTVYIHELTLFGHMLSYATNEHSISMTTKPCVTLKVRGISFNIIWGKKVRLG